MKGLSASAAAMAIRGLPRAHAQVPTSHRPSTIKALVFDVFGTVVDWRGSIIEEGTAWGKAKQLQIDWARFAGRWRAGYVPAMNPVF